MKDLRIFLEHRTINEITIKCDQTGKDIEPEYTIYDEQSLQTIVNKYKQNKEQFENLNIYFVKLNSQHKWIAKTGIPYKIDMGRMNDKFLSSDKIDYAYDDIITLLEDGDLMIIFCKK